MEYRFSQDNAETLFKAGEYERTVEFSQRALKLSPGDIDTRLFYSRALMALRKDVLAQKELRQCIRILPHSGLAYRLLGELSLRKNEYESAKMFLKQAISINHQDHEAKQMLSIVSSIKGTPSEELREKATRLHTTSPPSDISPMPENKLPPPSVKRGFGNYLHKVGMLNDKQLEDIIHYHKLHSIRIGQAAVTLGYVSAPKIEWAALAYHSSD